MNNSRENSFLDILEEIKNDVGKARLEDVEEILNHYNQNSIEVDGIITNYSINPMIAASLNARYHELTGKDHKVFIETQKKKLDELIDSDNHISINGKPNIYQKLRNNLTGDKPGIDIILDNKNSYINKFQNIKYKMSKASLEDINEILNHYDQDSVLIDSIECFFKPNVLEAASLNARYHELTGHDHPIFIEEQKKRLDEIIKSEEGIRVDGKPTIYEQLRDNKVEIGNDNHIIQKSTDIIMNPQDASLEDIESLLNYYNGNIVIINGVAIHPFNDPITATELNNRYYMLTGKNHPIYIEEVPKVVDNIMKVKNKLIRAGAFSESHFDSLEKIKQNALNMQKSNNQELQEMLNNIEDKENSNYKIK